MPTQTSVLDGAAAAADGPCARREGHREGARQLGSLPELRRRLLRTKTQDWPHLPPHQADQTQPPWGATQNEVWGAALGVTQGSSVPDLHRTVPAVCVTSPPSGKPAAATAASSSPAHPAPQHGSQTQAT